MPDLATQETLDHERFEILEQLEDWLETPLLVLGFAWLVLLVVELVWGLSPVLEALTTLIWVIFIADFAVRLIVAPNKAGFLKSNWLTALSLIVPALRVLRVARVVRILRLARATRGLRLLRVLSSLNRGLRALRAAMRRRGLGYIVILTLVFSLVGAAAMLAFEPELESYGDALWWTAMVMTTLGSDYWPQTGEGRILAFFLALYAFAIFGYVTASLATFLIGRDADDDEAEIAGARLVEALRIEIAALRSEMEMLRAELPVPDTTAGGPDSG